MSKRSDPPPLKWSDLRYACDGDGLPVFDRLRYRRQDGHVFLYAFDLIELDGDDLRHEPIERRKATLAKLIRRAKTGLVLNEHICPSSASRLGTKVEIHLGVAPSQSNAAACPVLT
jgi:hypothetical protein